jgi:hypothetical protein
MKMDQNLNAARVHNAELGFNTSRMTFIFGNASAIAINAFADLNSQAQLSLAAFVVIGNLASFLSFDTELKSFEAVAKDSSGENSHYVTGGSKTPWGTFRAFCLLICLVLAVTQVMAIYS